MVQDPKDLSALRESCCFADISQCQLPCSSLEMLKPSSPKPIFRFRIHINDRSPTFDKCAFEAAKPTFAYVSLKANLSLYGWTVDPYIRLGIESCEHVSRLQSRSCNGHADSK